MALQIIDKGESITPDKTIAPGAHRMHVMWLIISVSRYLGAIAVLFVAIPLVGGQGVGAFLDNIKNLNYQALGFNSLNATIVILLLEIVIFIGLLVYLVVSYRFETWELTQEGIIHRQGVLNKKVHQLSYHRVQTINSEESLLYRVFGLHKLSIETASRDGESIEIQGVTQAQVEAIKRTINLGKQGLLDDNNRIIVQDAVNGQTDEGTAVAAPPVEPNDLPLDPRFDAEHAARRAEGGVSRSHIEFSDVVGGISEGARGIFAGMNIDEQAVYSRKLTNRELVLSSFARSSAFGVIVALLLFVSQLSDYIPGANELLGNLIGSGLVEVTTKQEAGLTFMSVGLALGAIVVILVLAWIVSLITQMLVFGGFVLSRYSDRIEVKQGLLVRRSISVPLNRVQGLEVHRPMLLRLLGRATVTLHTVKRNPLVNSSGSHNTDDLDLGEQLIHPCIRFDEVPQFVAEALPEFDLAATDYSYEKLAPIAFRRSMIRWLLMLLPLIMATIAVWTARPLVEQIAAYPVEFSSSYLAFCSLFTALVVITFTVSAINRYFACRDSRVGTSDKMVSFVRGGFAIKTLYMSRGKLQAVQVRQTPFQARAQVASLKLHSASMMQMEMVDVTIDCAQRFIEWARPRHNMRIKAQEALREAGLDTQID